MKKQYITPTIRICEFDSASLLAASPEPMMLWRIDKENIDIDIVEENAITFGGDSERGDGMND